MNQITQHIPPMVETGQPPAQGEFETLEELQALPFVQRFMNAPGFFRLAQSDDRYLIAESYEGRSWWVIGFLKEPCAVLPVWRPIYRLRDERGEVADYEGDAVVSSCGDDVTMRDGRILQWVRENSDPSNAKGSE